MLDLVGGLDAAVLSLLCRTSKGFYIYGMHEDTWRALTLTELEGRFLFQGSWRATYLTSHPAWQARLEGRSIPRGALRVSGFYSDILFMPWLYSTMALEPTWLEVQNIDRVAGLSKQDFVERYERASKPVIITDVVREWEATSFFPL